MGSLRIRQIANSSNTDAASSSTAVATQQTAKAAVNAAAVTLQTTVVDAGASQTTDANVKAVVTQTVDSSSDATSDTAKAVAVTSTSSSSSTTVTEASTTADAAKTTTAAQTTITPSSSAKATSASGTTTSSSSSTTTGTTSASSSDTSHSSSANTASVTAQTTPASSLIQVTSVINGSTRTTEVVAFATDSTTDSTQPTAQPKQDLSTTSAFFNNKAAVGGVFGAVGLLSLILLLAIVLKIVRYRSRRKFEKELDEQVEKETRSGTPFGFGKDDDDDLNMMGRAPGVADPERAYGGGYTSQSGPGHAFGNTAAYATYSSAAAMQPAYYSPNSANGAPHRYPSQDTTRFDSRYNAGGQLARSGSDGSNRSYGTLNQAPMNAFSPVSGAAAGTVFAPATFSGNYGEYRNVSPPPSSSVRSSGSSAPYGARPSTPSSLTPGGRGPQVAIPVAPRGAFTPLGSRPDSPAILARYGHPSRGSQDDAYAANAYAHSSQRLGVPGPDDEPLSPKAALPNPFDQRG